MKLFNKWLKNAKIELQQYYHMNMKLLVVIVFIVEIMLLNKKQSLQKINERK